MSEQTLHTFCPLDCPDACSLTVQVADGKVVKLDGDRRNPVTDGFICTKVRHFPERVYGPHRLTEPLRRRPASNGQGSAKGDPDAFEPISWDEALDLLAAKLGQVRDELGGEAILPFSYGGSNGFLTQDTTDARLFRRLEASRLARTVCAAPSSEAAKALYGKMPGVAYQDYEHARLIVVWGANPSATHIHLVPYIRRAQASGAKLVVVDPRRIPLANQADLHLAPRPGTDLPLALALIRLLFEQGGADESFLAEHTTGAEQLRERAAEWTPQRAAELCGIEAGDIERFARLYAEISPAVVRCGWGLERNRNGGAAVAAVLALPAVAGKLGVRGGGYTMSNTATFPIDLEPAVDARQPPTRTVNMNRLGRVLLGEEPGYDDPPVALLFVYNCNPLMTMPEQQRVRRGLEREDLFTVVFDPVMTDTARYADLVLPATTFLEHSELSRGYGAQIVQRSRPVIEPVGQARPNHDVFLELARRLGLARDGEIDTQDGLAEAAIAPLGPEVARQLAETGAASPRFSGNGGPQDEKQGPVQLVDIHPLTADRKIHLAADRLRDAEGEIYRYRELDPRSVGAPEAPAGGNGTAREPAPLALISPATSKTISSSLGERERGPAAIQLHPKDAAARGLTDGQAVRVYNRLGEVRCRIEVSDEVRPGVAFLPKGLWSHNTENGATANALAPDTLTDLGDGACFNDARVEVEGV